MKIWTAENIAYLKANYDSGDLADIADRIGVTVKTVRNKAYMLGIYRPGTKARRPRGKYNPNPITETTRRCVCWWMAEGDSPAEIGEMLCRPAREIQGSLRNVWRTEAITIIRQLRAIRAARNKRKRGNNTVIPRTAMEILQGGAEQAYRAIPAVL